MRKTFLFYSMTLALSMLLSLLAFSPAFAAGPARTVTIRAGYYIVNVNMFQDPPYADQLLEMTVVLNQAGTTVRDAPTSGRIVAQPGLGTDATELHAPLTQVSNSPRTLSGQIRMPVRGAWNILIELNGPHGQGTGSFAVDVAAPGSIPVWLAWVIAALPISGVIWWIWRQHSYRRTLLLEQEQQENQAQLTAPPAS